MRKVLLVISLLMMPACKRAEPPAAPHALPFIDDDYAAALQQARAKKLPIFVDAWAPWCHSCRYFKATVLKDPALARIADKFVWLSMDTEKPSAAAFLQRHPISSWPTLLVVDPTTESAVFKWTGIATRESLEAMLLDAERAFAGAHGPLEETLAQADRLNGEGRHLDAAQLYRKVITEAPKDWPSRTRAVESLILALDFADDFGGCASAAIELVPSLPRTTGFANATAMGLMCTLNAAPGTPNRAEALAILEKLATEALDVPGVLADDKSGIYELLVEARKDAKDAEGVRRLATAWLLYLEGEAAKTTDAEARGAFDSHILSASLALGDPARAVRRLMQSEQDLPGDYNPAARLAVAYLEMGKLDEANAAAARALLRVYGPRRVRVLETMSKIQVKKGNPGGARQALEDAIAVVNALPPSQQPRGAMQRLQGQLAAIQ